jgi:hypothetical protein
VVVAVILVRPVKAAFDQIVDVVVVGYGVVAAAVAVCMRRIAGNGGGVAARVCGVGCDHVFIDVVAVRMMQVAVVQVVDVVVVTDRGVSAVGSVLVRMTAVVNVVGAHVPTLRRCLNVRKESV